jgi:hypothetical protein
MLPNAIPPRARRIAPTMPAPAAAPPRNIIASKTESPWPPGMRRRGPAAVKLTPGKPGLEFFDLAPTHCRWPLAEAVPTIYAAQHLLKVAVSGLERFPEHSG